MKDKVRELIDLEEEHRNYRDPVKFLRTVGFTGKIGEIIEGDLEEMEAKGLVDSRIFNTEAAVRTDEAIEYELKEVEYYEFTDKLVERLDYSFGKEGEASEREEEFLETIMEVQENHPTEGVPVSVLQALRPEEDSLEVDNNFEDPLDLLESVNRKGLVRVESDSRGRLSKDVFYSEKLGEDVFVLTVIDRVFIDS